MNSSPIPEREGKKKCGLFVTLVQLTGILLLVILVADILYVEESYPPVLLSRKANKLRKLTGNWALHSKHQENDQSLKSWVRTYLLVPVEMLIDPICFLINLYASFVYAIIYLYVVHALPDQLSEKLTRL